MKLTLWLDTFVSVGAPSGRPPSEEVPWHSYDKTTPGTPVRHFVFRLAASHDAGPQRG